MAYKKQAQSNRKSQSKPQKSNDVNDNCYITTTGGGYVNFLQERQSKKGPFTTCLVRLAIGSKAKGNREYRELDVIVSGEKTEELLWKYQDEIADPNCNIYFKFKFSDLKPKFYERDDGEIIAGIDTYLFAIEKIWIDGELEYEYSAEANDQNDDDEGDDEEQEQAKPRKGYSNSRVNNRQSQSGKASSSARNSAGSGSSRSTNKSRKRDAA